VSDLKDGIKVASRCIKSKPMVMPLSKQILGAWCLVSFEQEASDGQRSFPMGKDALGSIYYLPDGYVSVQIMTTNRSEYIEPSVCCPARLKYSGLGYLAYSGTYQINSSETVITHKIIISLFPEWLGGQQIRLIKFDGEYLSLSSDGAIGPEQIRFHLLWKRLCN
jgi:hypothetical protein